MLHSPASSLRRFCARTLALAALIPAVSAAADPLPLPDLSEQRWQARVLVIDTPSASSNAYRTQAADLLAAWDGLQERDIRIITRTDAPAFRFRLVGKDGDVKLNRAAPVPVAELFALIDSMPMRRAETAAAPRPTP